MPFPQGVDVSSYQSTTFSTGGLDFAFAKATESTGYVNPNYSGQVAHARSAGLVVGHYHFLHPGNAEAQADYFLAHADLKPGDILACDWEADGCSQADRDAFMQRVKSQRPEYRVVLYCNLDFWLHIDTESYCGDGLWIADYVAAGHPRITHPWVFHQYTDAGGMDKNVANFADAAALHAWAMALVPKSAPAPTPAPTSGGTMEPVDIWAYKHDPNGEDAYGWLGDVHKAVTEPSLVSRVDGTAHTLGEHVLANNQMIAALVKDIAAIKAKLGA